MFGDIYISVRRNCDSYCVVCPIPEQIPPKIGNFLNWNHSLKRSLPFVLIVGFPSFWCNEIDFD